MLEVVEPSFCRRRGRRDVGERSNAAAVALEERAPLGERLLPLRLPLPDEHVEGDEPRRDLAGEPVDAALGGVQAGLHRVEVDGAFDRDHDLAVERRVGGSSSPSGRSSGK